MFSDQKIKIITFELSFVHRGAFAGKNKMATVTEYKLVRTRQPAEEEDKRMAPLSSFRSSLQIIVDSGGAGASSLMRQFCTGCFDKQYDPHVNASPKTS